MVRRTNLRVTTGEALAELTKRLSEQANRKATVPTGVKDMGQSGDIVWTDSSGAVVSSMRELATEMGQVDTDLSRLNDEILPSIKNATYIDDNSITTRLLAANSVGADQIIANSITGDKIRANSIAAEKILGGAFTGKTFTGGTFIGATFATDSHPSSNGGVMINEGGLRAWNTSGTQTLSISSGSGVLKASSRLVVSSATDNRGILLYPLISGNVTAIYLSDTGANGSEQAAILRTITGNGEEPLQIRGARNSGVYADGGVYVSGGPISTSQDALVSRNAIISGNLRVRNIGTVSNTSANVRIAADALDGTFYKVTSSRRYKKNIVNWSPETHRVLGLQPRQWQHDDPNNPPDMVDETWGVGFIAEEVDELGLTPLVQYVGDGRGGWIPDSLNYDRFAAAHQVVLRDHEARIAELENTVENLTREKVHG